MLQKQSQTLPGSGPCPKDEQFSPVQQWGLCCSSNVPVLLTGHGCSLGWAGFTPMGQVALYCRHRLVKCGAPGGGDPSAPTEPCSTTTTGTPRGQGKPILPVPCLRECREKPVRIDTETPNQDTVPLLFVEAIILCRCLRNTKKTTHKVTSFQIWIHSRTAVDNYQHLVICSRTFSQHVHHAMRP